MSRLTQVGGRLYRGEVSFDFVGRRRMWYTFSVIIVVLGFAGLIVRGLDFSVEFKGGAIFTVTNAPTATVSDLQTATTDAGVTGAIVQQSHSTKGTFWQVQTPALDQATTNKVQDTISSELHISQSNVSVNTVGSSWGGQITQKAVQALIAFLIVVVIYLSIAFEWKMAAAAFVALLHTLVITVGVYAWTAFQVSPATVIGFLTILGYALYDTVVVFDKVRENTAGLLGGARQTYSDAANLALNQTLVRSINTSLIALLPVGSILFIGGVTLGVGELKDLALVLFVGILAGAYASICIATPVLAQFKEREPQYRALAKRVALRGSSPRAEKRAEAKAASGSKRAGAATVRAQSVDDIAEGVDEAADDRDVAPTASPVVVSRPTTGGARPGPRQQPRRDGRSSSPRHRPAGKKKRR